MIVGDQELQHHLKNFTFKELFIDLGWDNPRDHKPLIIACKGQAHILNPVVEKRGVKIYL